MIYLIVCRENNTCKIGKSNNPINRLSQLQTGSPFPLELVSYIDKDELTELEIHNLFKDYRLEGEWFKYCDEIKSFFNIEEAFLTNKEIFNVIFRISNVAAKLYFSLFHLYKNERFFISSINMKDIELSAGIKKASVIKGLKELIKENLIYKHQNYSYQINPRYIFNGSLKSRNAALKAIIEVGCKDC